MDFCRDALSAYSSSISQAKAALRSSEPGSRTERAMRVCKLSFDRIVIKLVNTEGRTQFYSTYHPWCLILDATEFGFVQICIGEQEALASTLQFFEERFSKLDSLEYYQERRLKGLGLLDEDGRCIHQHIGPPFESCNPLQRNASAFVDQPCKVCCWIVTTLCACIPTTSRPGASQ